MQKDELFIQILQKCIAIELMAVKLYRRFSEQAVDEELQAFWQNMSDEEKSHVVHWSYLLSLAKEGVVPNMFESHHRMKEQVDDLHSRVERLVEDSMSPIDTTTAFTIACHLEFYMLNREFSYLLTFMRNILDEATTEDLYCAHLGKFFEGLDRYCESPELRLLGETIYRVFLENKELTLQSHTDPLTGLLNKRGLLQVVKPLAHLALRKKYVVGVMMIDIDSFKALNDSQGHKRGDEILKMVADSIRSHTRRSDIVARYGGDEFLVYLSEVDDHHLQEVGEKIRRSVAAESGDNMSVTISIGVAQKIINTDVDKELEGLIEKADHCLYQAKRHRNRVVMHNEQEAQLAD
jgi:diguanylate cyclase (GGDEF)-like protein